MKDQDENKKTKLPDVYIAIETPNGVLKYDGYLPETATAKITTALLEHYTQQDLVFVPKGHQVWRADD